MTRAIALALAAVSLAACRAGPPAEPQNEAIANSVAPPAEVVEPRPSSTPARVSQFTDLDPASCPIIEENREEGPYWRRRCTGAGGSAVEWTESDLRQGLELVAADGKRTNLRLSDLVAKGAFNRLGPRIEWRGQDAAKPETLTVRMFVANGANPNAPDRSLLTVSRLRPTPCLIAIVEPGSRQSENARRIADSPLSGCISEGSLAAKTR
jgi:hypothetical protein